MHGCQRHAQWRTVCLDPEHSLLSDFSSPGLSLHVLPTRCSPKSFPRVEVWPLSTWPSSPSFLPRVSSASVILSHRQLLKWATLFKSRCLCTHCSCCASTHFPGECLPNTGHFRGLPLVKLAIVTLATSLDLVFTSISHQFFHDEFICSCSCLLHHTRTVWGQASILILVSIPHVLACTMPCW